MRKLKLQKQYTNTCTLLITIVIKIGKLSFDEMIFNI